MPRAEAEPVDPQAGDLVKGQTRSIHCRCFGVASGPRNEIVTTVPVYCASVLRAFEVKRVCKRA
eukprot:6748143-Pyramimonas_sp.AAC.2